MRMFSVLLTLAALNTLAPAQGWVRLTDGTRIEGDVVYETKDRVDVIDMVGVRHRISRDDVDKLSRGKSFSKAIAARLADINEGDPDALYALGCEALAKKSTKAEGERLLRRVLALDDSYAGVREKLGHVMALDRWFENQREADQALTASYEAQGYIKFGKGWAAPDQVDLIKAAPQEWMVDQGAWQLVDEVMNERGSVKLRGAWYEKEEADFVRLAAIIEKKSGQVLEGAQVGTVVVIHYRGRDHAKTLAKQIMTARNWFAKTYEKPSAAESPLCLEVVVAKKLDWQQLLKTLNPEIAVSVSSGGPKDRGEMSGISFTDLLGSLSHDEAIAPSMPGLDLSGISSDAFKTTEASRMINALGFILMAGLPDKPGRLLPWWLLTASSIHAEIVATGQTIVSQATDEENYDRSDSNDFHGNHGSDLKDLRAKLKETLKRRKISMRTMFFARGTQLDHETDQYAVVLLQWLLETRREQMLAYVHASDSGKEDQIFETYFKMSFEEAEKLFLAWI